MSDNISPEKLAAAGYERIDPATLLMKDPFLVAAWEKEVSDDLGVRYRISITETDISSLADRPCGNLFKAETRFRFTNGGSSSVTHSINHQDIEDVEDYFEEIWCHMGLGHVVGGHDYDAMDRRAGDK